MRLTAILALLVLAALIAFVWWSGAYQTLLWWAARQQHVVQTALASRIQALRSGDGAAFWSLVGLCAGYGFLHALGPGHGKLLVTGGSLATQVSARRMALIALAGSLAQAGAAILIVYGSLALLSGTVKGTMAASEGWITAFGNAAIALIGGWLLLRGARGMRAALRAGHHAHDPGHGPGCGCGHAHAPDPEAVARAAGPMDTALLIFGMAARPCTGALMILVIAWRMDLRLAGVASVLAMGLGTAAFTALVAVLAVTSRDTALFATGGGQAGRIAAPALQIGAGLAILVIGASLAATALPG
ncbi:MAG: hypothetical protein KDK03_00465 [Rhodobacteraceae bacterium]|nr:hypothetical protein [Paracoccaceae bacterium]